MIDAIIDQNSALEVRTAIESLAAHFGRLDAPPASTISGRCAEPMGARGRELYAPRSRGRSGVVFYDAEKPHLGYRRPADGGPSKPSCRWSAKKAAMICFEP
jgi:hypothetical protein